MSGLYANYKALALGGGVHTLPDLTADEIRCGLANESTDYTTADAYATELANDQDWDDIDNAAYTRHVCYSTEPTIVLTSGNISTTDGVFDCTDDITFVGVALDPGKDVDVLLHYVTGAAITDDALICLHDQFTPVVPNGGDIVVQYHPSGIFAL